MAEKSIVKPKKLRPKALTPEEEKRQEMETIKIRATFKTLGAGDLALVARKKLFLITPEIRSAEFFYLPCWRVVLDFRVSYFKESRADTGQVEFIIDPIKGCGANEDEIKLDIAPRRVPKEIVGFDYRVEQEEAERKAKVDARWKVLLARYKKPAELEVAKVEEFYRPYYKAETVWRDKVEIQYIAADDFANYFVYN